VLPSYGPFFSGLTCGEIETDTNTEKLMCLLGGSSSSACALCKNPTGKKGGSYDAKGGKKGKKYYCTESTAQTDADDNCEIVP